MFMRSLFRETQRLADMFAILEVLRGTDGDGDPCGWKSPYGLLEITRSCALICELSTMIAKAGYRECDKPTLDAISEEAREILYSVQAQIAV